MRLSEAGSVAEAALSVTNIFSAAQMAADLYLQEISCMKEDTKKECTKMIEDANRTVAKIYSDGEKQYMALRSRYEDDYQKWQRLQEKIQALEE